MVPVWMRPAQGGLLRWSASDFSVRTGQMTFFYLDRSGIWSLFEQTINDVEKEFDRLYKTNPTGGLEEKNTLARRLSEPLGLGELTAEGTFGLIEKST